MSKQALIVRSHEGNILNVLGVPLRFLCGAEQTGNAWSLMENVLPKHAGPTPHHHPWDEAYYVVEGEVDFMIEGRPQRIRAGDFVYAPANTVHAFSGASDEPARMLVFDAPAHAEAFFEELHDEGAQVPRDLQKVAEVGDRHGITFVR